ncbi:MAG: YitT family protein [Monoglobales bacterium]
MKKFKYLLLTTLGAAITGFVIAVFLTPNKIVGGGVSGISTILYLTMKVPQGLSYALTNILLLLVGLKFLGKQFTIRTLLGTGLTSLFVQLFSYIPPVIHDIFLASVVGGALFGIGIGITFVAGASTGGTDVLGRLLQHKNPNLPIGKILMFVDGFIILLSLLVFKNFELALFGIVTLFVSSTAIDWLIRSLNISKVAFVITDLGEVIAKMLVSTSPRGVTLINATGAYTSNRKNVLFCALKSRELQEFQKKILSIDPAAFIVYSESQQIFGNGFYIYR